MKAIGYIRVSTEEQGQDERFSLPHQRDHIRQECKARGWELLAVFEDTESGKSTKKRKGFKSAMEAVQTADILVVHELDRLSRNMIDTLIIVDDLNKQGKKFVSIHDNIDSSSEQGELQLHILAVFAHYFRKQLGRKVYGSMLTRAEAGLYNTKPPFGYKLQDKKLVINPDEVWIVKRIFELYLENVGFRGIAEELNRLRVRTRQGALWSSFPIKRMLMNQVYIGNTVWNKTKRNDTKEIKRPEEEWVVVENTHEPIIDRETFKLVQERIKRKAEIGGRAQASPYLLAGLIKCGHCGSPMVGNTNKGRYAKKNGEAPVYRRYICSGYHKQGICKYVFCHKEAVEEKVLSYIKAFVGTPQEAKLLQRKKKVDMAYLTGEQKRLTNELDKVKKRFQRQLEAFEADIIDLAELKKAKDRVREQETAIKKELARIESKLSSIDRDEITRRRMSDFYDVFNSKDIQAQKVWLQRNIEKIVFNDMDNIKIYFTL